MTKAEIQQKAVEMMRDTPLLILQWATGCGKSKAAIDIVKDLDTHKVLLAVAEIAHRENWKQEFLKWGLPLDTGIVIETYASLKNHKGEKYDLIILDEAHLLSFPSLPQVDFDKYVVIPEEFRALRRIYDKWRDMQNENREEAHHIEFLVDQDLQGFTGIRVPTHYLRR